MPIEDAAGQQTNAGLMRMRFRETRSATEELCRSLTAEDMMVQSCPEASPTKWHLAHTSWFFETFILREFVPGYRPFDDRFLWLFNSYYKSLGEMPEKKLRASFSRPGLDEILAFRRHVNEAMDRLLETGAPEAALSRLLLGLHHEQQHLELIATDIKHAFFTNPLHPAFVAGALPVAEIPAPPIAWVGCEGGLVEIGDAGSEFSFDNETPRHRVFLEPYRLASRLTSCAEYLAFMEDAGYQRPELWLSEGWDTLEREGWRAPLYWRRDEAGKWQIFTLRGWQSLENLSETPVCHVSFFEADAFARWAGKRLATEFEWEHAAAQRPISGNLFESGLLHPSSASITPGLTQIFGDVWEWTASAYSGYPGYKPLPGALGEYNGKFMSSQMVLRGGSCVTPVSHLRVSYRNFFQPATRWQFSGIRLADGANA
ncbi:ergothioneine biosynthesis protein EgtB [Terriglobus sp. 2YAB30_2]|uniref:ergothioneine biosynthesis protein EgtB n=1 Tax=unclassified Terriglobus TaxID=2628988 RepID=UPI003F9A475E